MSELEAQPILPQMTNGKVAMLIGGVDVSIRYDWYPGLVDPANFQWRGDVPLFDGEGEFEKMERVGRTMPVCLKKDGSPHRYEYLKAMSVKDLEAFVVDGVNARQVKVQAYHLKADERELAEINAELAEVPEKEARKLVLEAKLSAGEV